MVRQIRESQGLTIQTLADRSGIDQSFLSRLERGERDWTVDTLSKVSTGLKVKIVVVFG